MFELNMASLSWTRHKGNGIQTYGHSLNRISKNRFLLIGGFKSEKVWVFGASKPSNDSWMEEVDFGSALFKHSSVVVPNNNSISVLCLGGDATTRSPSQMIVYDIE